MKLFEVPRETWVKVLQNEKLYFFDHLDGMYSYCLDENKEIAHLACWTEVEVTSDPNSQ